MVAMKMFMSFDDSLLDRHPDLKDYLKPNDQYPELKHFQKDRLHSIPEGSLNTKIIINNGEIVERIYETPKGQLISLFSKSSDLFVDQAA